MAIYTVTNNNDFGPGSFREAIIQANLEQSSEIVFHVSGVIRLKTQLPDLTSNVKITAVGVTLDGQGFASTILTLSKNCQAKIHGLTIRGGTGHLENSQPFNYVLGGGLYVHPSASCRLESCIIEDNSCCSANNICYGAGIFIYGVTTLINCTVQKNKCVSNNLEASAAGIANAGQLLVIDSTISDNYNIIGSELNNVSIGNGLASAGNLIMVNSTVSGNFNMCPNKQNAQLCTGGLYNNGTANLINCTIAHNFQTGTGGGIYNIGSLEIGNTIIADNVAASDADVSGNFKSNGYNLITKLGSATGFGSHDLKNVSAHIQPLANYGGPTLTLKPYLDSPAVSAASLSLLTTFEQKTNLVIQTDQRGYPRVTRQQLDIGSVQLGL